MTEEEQTHFELLALRHGLDGEAHVHVLKQIHLALSELGQLRLYVHVLQLLFRRQLAYGGVQVHQQLLKEVFRKTIGQQRQRLECESKCHDAHFWVGLQHQLLQQLKPIQLFEKDQQHLVINRLLSLPIIARILNFIS